MKHGRSFQLIRFLTISGAIIGVMGGTAGCGGAASKPDHAARELTGAIAAVDADEADQADIRPNEVGPEDVDVPKAPEVLVQDILATDARIENLPHSQIPIEINSDVQRWIEYFTVRDRERFGRFLERGMYYRDLVEKVLKENKVPPELYYLAMIESGFRPVAASRVRAVGIWQFMRGTGRLYGLKTNSYLDERRDVIRATRAAARYLKDLHDEFGSWYLAMAAYNAGPGRIRSAIRRGGTHDFWKLVESHYLPRETRDYVPKFLAAALIGRDPEKYSFHGMNAKKFPEVRKVEVPASVHLREIARKSGISYSTIRAINPHLIREITPRNTRSYDVWIPKDKAAVVESLGDDFQRVRYSAPVRLSRRSRHASLRIHRVRRGETLFSIARHYRVPVARLKKVNRLRSTRIFRGQALKIASRT